jgi:hypothetical protein
MSDFGKFARKGYKTVSSTLPASMTAYITVFQGTARKYIVYNDSDVESIVIKLNDLDNDPIVIKAGEWFGEKISLKSLFVKNESGEIIPYRVVLGGVTT